MDRPEGALTHLLATPQFGLVEIDHPNRFGLGTNSQLPGQRLKASTIAASRSELLGVELSEELELNLTDL